MTSMPTQADRTLDLRGYLCPWVEMIASRSASEMPPGGVLHIVLGDRRSLTSVIALFSGRPGSVLDSGENEKGYYCRIQF